MGEGGSLGLLIDTCDIITKGKEWGEIFQQISNQP